MTQARRRQRSRKWIWWVLFLVLIIGAIVVAYFVWDGYFREKGGDGNDGSVTSVPVTEENLPENSEEILEDLAEKVVEEKKVTQFEPGDESEEEANELTGVVTYSEVVDGKFQIGVNIDQFLDSGSCELILRQGGKIVHQEVVDMEPMVSTSTCKDFDVPVEDLVSGDVDIEVYMNSEDKQGTIRGVGKV